MQYVRFLRENSVDLYFNFNGARLNTLLGG